MKRKIREIHQDLKIKNDEIELLKRNIKSTKIGEIEVEIKAYVDECTRLRHQLEEVIKSKDTFADPTEIRLIEEKFQQQEMVIAQMRKENSELAMAYAKKEEENGQMRELVAEMDRREKKKSG